MFCLHCSESCVRDLCLCPSCPSSSLQVAISLDMDVGEDRGGLDPAPTPGVQPPFPCPIFSSLHPPPFFPYFFGWVPCPKFRFFAPTHLTAASRPFFAKSPPYSRPPNSLWPSDAIWWHKTGSLLVQVMACCLMQSLRMEFDRQTNCHFRMRNDWNKRYIELFDYPTSDICRKGQTCLTFWHPFTKTADGTKPLPKLLVVLNYHY